jgi:hypothetical protein
LFFNKNFNDISKNKKQKQQQDDDIKINQSEKENAMTKKKLLTGAI